MIKQITQKRVLVIISLITLVMFSLGCTNNDYNNPLTNNVEKNNRFAVIETDKGFIKFELYEKRAPLTTENFIKLAERGFYNELTFHRVDPDFVIQGGDPLGTGMGGSNETIPLEIHPELRHTDGAVAMARYDDPNSASSQFYITIGSQPYLDGRYAVFGQVIEGQDVVRQIVPGDKMLTVTITTD